MARAERFRVNAPSVVSDLIDGEVVVINLDTGDYYSLPGVACDIWSGVRRGLSVGRIVEDLVGAYEADAATIEAAAVEFIVRLRAEGLIVPDDTEPAAEPAAERGGGVRRGFAPPTLEKYDDMREFLLVDPIHEVDVTDWPRVRPRDEPG